MLSEINTTVQGALKALETCAYTTDAFKANIDSIQHAVDRLNFEEYSNLQSWVDDMNLRIETILLNRLERAIREWIDLFDSADPPADSRDTIVHRDSVSSQSSPAFKQIVHEISIRNQTIFLKPPLELAQSIWLQQLQAWIGIVGTLHKVEASRYDMRLAQRAEAAVPDFSHLPDQCAKSLADVQKAIREKLTEVSEYVDKWLQFQALWDLRREQVYDELQEDLGLWLQLLQEIISSRNTFDTSESSRSFGNITINYEQVQVKVNGQYDQWQHDIVARFAALLGSRMNLVFSEIQQARKDLEVQVLESSTSKRSLSSQ